MYNLAIRKCTSPPLLAQRLKIFKWKFTTPPGIEPQTCWTRGRHATIWASATSLCMNCRKIEMRGNQMNRTPTTRWQWNLYYSKVIARSVNTFIPLGNVQMKETPTNVFLHVAKNVEVRRGKIWDVQRMLKCLSAKPLKLIPHRIGSMGTGVIM